ncbi:hypothetical protein QNH98_07930 [Myroides sp. mNGS23_01]|nr:hypothetical protein [Myroides sp. mNGS23_01]WHT40477.1 hypothetical protein QNH98_07930 [Myroides sp. mNGS23_01]
MRKEPRYHLILLGIVTILSFFSGQLLSFAQNKEDIFNNYTIFLEVKQYEQTPYIKIKEVDSHILNAACVNEQPTFWDFLLTNYTKRLDYDALAQIKDTAVVQQKVIQHLEQDKHFRSLLQTYEAKVLDHTQAKDTVSMDDILNVAVKFFHLTGVTPAGAYSSRICVGINALKQTEKKRSPFLEAFAFDVIINNLNNERYPFYDDFIQSVHKVYKLNLGIDEQEQLLRAQGALFIQMFQSVELHKLLLEEYERKKNILPFYLVT